jgi:Calcium binding
MGVRRKRGHAAGQRPRLSKAQLDELVEEALVDAYGESEQVTGFFTMMENDLRLPFETEILGMTVIVEGIDITEDDQDITEDDQLVAVCRKDKTKQRISLSELPLPLALPKGAEWIAAYRYWRTGKIR